MPMLPLWHRLLKERALSCLDLSKVECKDKLQPKRPLPWIDIQPFESSITSDTSLPLEFCDKQTFGNQARSVGYTYSETAGLDVDTGKFQKGLRQVCCEFELKLTKQKDVVQVQVSASEVDLDPLDADFSFKGRTERLPLAKIGAEVQKNKFKGIIEPKLSNIKSNTLLSVQNIQLWIEGQKKSNTLVPKFGLCRTCSNQNGNVKESFEIFPTAKESLSVSYDLKSVQKIQKHISVQTKLKNHHQFQVQTEIKNGQGNSVCFGLKLKKSLQIPLQIKLKRIKVEVEPVLYGKDQGCVVKYGCALHDSKTRRQVSFNVAKAWIAKASFKDTFDLSVSFFRHNRAFKSFSCNYTF